jgi:hypothetical protein
VRNKQTLMYCSANLGALGTSALLYVSGVPLWLAVVSAFTSVLLVNMILWATFRLKRCAEAADALAGDPERRRIARQRNIHFGAGLLLLFLGIASAGLSFCRGDTNIVNLCATGFIIFQSVFFLVRSRKFRM